MKAKMTQITMTREEQLEFENIQLRMAAADRELGILRQRNLELQTKIAQANNLSNLDGWLIHISNGTISKPEALVGGSAKE